MGPTYMNWGELECNQSVLIIIDFGSDCLRLLRLLQLHVLATIEYYCWAVAAAVVAQISYSEPNLCMNRIKPTILGSACEHSTEQHNQAAHRQFPCWLDPDSVSCRGAVLNDHTKNSFFQGARAWSYFCKGSRAVEMWLLRVTHILGTKSHMITKPSEIVFVKHFLKWF